MLIEQRDYFSKWVPFEVMKGERNPANGGDSEPVTGRIGGIISSAAEDFQGEELNQDGLDWSYFLKHGWFNYEHQPGPENVLGHPETVTKCTARGRPATRVEGVLYLHNDRARRIYENARAIQKAQAPRSIGFSVEGKVLQRLGKKVMKARVLNVAVTAHPVNPDGRLEVLEKAMANIGYQHPATPAVGAPLSALVPQSLADTPSEATFARYAMGVRRMSVDGLAALLTRTYPHLAYDKAISIAREVARVVG